MTANTSVLDLSDTTPVETYTLNLLRPGTPTQTGWKLLLAGPSHPDTIAMANDIGRELIEKEKAQEFAQVNGRKYKVDEESVEERRRKNVSRVCRRILGWSPDPTFKSVSPDPIKFSVATATELFLRPDMAGYFIQITEYLNSETSFTPPSKKV